MVYTQYSLENVYFQSFTLAMSIGVRLIFGWITGHSYIVYGPLLAGCHDLMFEEFQPTLMPEDSGQSAKNIK